MRGDCRERKKSREVNSRVLVSYSSWQKYRGEGLFYRVVNSVLRWVVGPGRWHNHCTLRYVKQTLRQPSYFINKHVHNYFSIQERFAGNSSKAGFLIVHHTALNLNDGCAGPLWLTRFRHYFGVIDKIAPCKLRRYRLAVWRGSNLFLIQCNDKTWRFFWYFFSFSLRNFLAAILYPSTKARLLPIYMVKGAI